MASDIEQAVLDALNTVPHGSPAPTAEADVRLANRLILALSSTSAAPLQAHPNARTRRQGIRDAIASAACEAGVVTTQLDLLRLFLVASAAWALENTVSLGCSWASFLANRHSVAEPPATADPGDRLTWALGVFDHAKWSPSASAVGGQAPLVTRTLPRTAPAARDMAGIQSPAVVIESDDDEGEAEAANSRSTRRSASAPTGESPSATELMTMSKYLKELQADPGTCCGGPQMMLGSTANRIASAHSLLARHSFAAAPSDTVSLDRIFDSRFGYAFARVSPWAMRKPADLRAMLVAATQGASVLAGVDKSFIANALRNLTFAGKRLGLRIHAESGRVIADILNSQDLPRTAAGLASFWIDTILPAVIDAIQVALSKRPMMPSANPPEGAVAPCDELARFLGEVLTHVVAAAASRWVEWIIAFLFAEIYFAGRAHLMLHSGLKSPDSEFPTLAAISGLHVLGNCPNYFAYGSRGTFDPRPRAASEPEAPPASASASTTRAGKVGRGGKVARPSVPTPQLPHRLRGSCHTRTPHARSRSALSADLATITSCQIASLIVHIKRRPVQCVCRVFGISQSGRHTPNT